MNGSRRARGSVEKSPSQQSAQADNSRAEESQGSRLGSAAQEVLSCSEAAAFGPRELISVQKYATPLSEATTPSLEAAAKGMPATEDVMPAAQADTEAWYGRMKNAHDLTRRAMDAAQRNDANETAAAYQAAAALREVESGNREQARVESIFPR